MRAPAKKMCAWGGGENPWFDELNPKCYDEIVGQITLRKALEEYISIYMAYRNFAERTRVEYQNDLEDFVEFAEKFGLSHTDEVGLPIVERFIAGLEHKGFSSLTRKRKVVTLRSFFSFLYSDGYIHSNLSSRIILPFAETTTPNVLTQAECDRLRAASAANPRDKAIIELLLQTGIKLSELTRLTLNDIEFERVGEEVSGFVRIVGGRGKKDRLIPLNIQACLAIKKYLYVRKSGSNDNLFLNRFDEFLSDRGVQKILRKYLKMAGIKRASIHTLRHTFGVYHLAKGMSLKSVQEIMGHRDSRSTSVYKTLAKGVVLSATQEHAW